jgi:hypothetical protein
MFTIRYVPTGYCNVVGTQFSRKPINRSSAKRNTLSRTFFTIVSVGKSIPKTPVFDEYKLGFRLFI